MQAPGRAKLILIRGQDGEGMSFHLNATHHVCGRGGEGVLLPFDDPHLNPAHADFFYRENELYVKDADSLNRTYLRIREPELLVDGDLIRAGVHVFRYERLRSRAKVDADGTEFYASPPPRTEFRLVEILEGGQSGRAYASPHGEVVVGRDGCDINCPDDLHMSRKHFKVIAGTGGAHQLVDLESHNGTYLELREPKRLAHGDYVFMSDLLLRVEISA